MAGPACCAAASPVSTKMPVPMMAPMPSVTRLIGPRTRLSECSPLTAASAFSCSIDFVAKIDMKNPQHERKGSVADYTPGPIAQRDGYRVHRASMSSQRIKQPRRHRDTEILYVSQSQHELAEDQSATETPKHRDSLCLRVSVAYALCVLRCLRVDYSGEI